MAEKQLVEVNVPYLDRWFKLHVCIKNGYTFQVVREWTTKNGIEMMELAGYTGKEIPWRNKIMKRWTKPTTAAKYYVQKYPVPRFVRFVERHNGG